MKLANVNGRLTLRREDGDVDIAKASDGLFGPDASAVFEQWEAFRAWADEHGPSAVASTSAPDDQLTAPVTRPRQIFAIGLNYREHAAESGHAVPEHPPTFTKFASSLTGPTGDVVLPDGNVDWEVELVVIIGREARNVSREQGWEHIAGITVGQDLSERVGQLQGPVPQFSLGKSHPGFSPMGPVVVTVDEFDNPDDLELGCSINGEIVQKGRTSDLVFSIPDLIARLSAVVTLLPGDVIFTGTPAGVGLGRSPQRYLAPGDVLTSYVEGVGDMTHRFISASA